MSNALILIIDQMRFDYINLLKNYCKKRGTNSFISELFQRGAAYSNGQVKHLPTSTPTGHATISTGTTPRKSGIVGLEWYDKQQERIVRACEGNNAKFLMSESLVAIAKQSNYQTFVIAGKKEPAILLSGDRADLTLYPELYCNGKETVLLMQERRDVPEIPPTIRLKYTPSWIVANRLWIRRKDMRTKKLDGLIAKTTELILKNEVRSRNKWVMFTSFSGLDNLGHLFGPCSEYVLDDLFHIDKWLRSLYQKLSPDTLIVLTSDHGCTSLKGGIKVFFERRLPVPSLRKFSSRFLFAILNEKGKIVDVKVLSKEVSANIHFKDYREFGMVGEGICMVYVKKNIKIVKMSILKLLQNYIAHACYRKSSKLPIGIKEKVESLGHHRSGDLIIIPANGYRFLKPNWQVGLGEHGSASEEEQRIPILFVGPKINKGVYKYAKLQDLAPTLASYLNIPLSPFLKDGGKVLAEIYPSSNRICNSI